ncbi:quaternary amine ABC transporter ATP-binding protein [Albidovulum sp.]|uniref:quaternary amine ABC transporter ATP-binding protein n=1 Tax=Albidovulum sp. TaxID=1872424 RepID=UPI001D711CC7|nr:betaine/proline/choline family ABC transporter ATP-binding protein [Paracoccaceae bacterium]MCP5376198.1 betaine/proline/choline family ABC transporter ATP-binding protein [Paracoccaceae bacterium]HPE25938.1 betaine/proline/choline family ABC transporter ATP-binding protein [Albidovulum sp.]
MTDPTPLQQPAGEKLVCRNVWKLFGPRARETLNRLGAVATPDRLNEAGLVPAVRDVSLAVREGEIFVIMGLSGSGKSTLVRLMSRLVEPTAGEILFNGRDLLSASEAEMIDIRRHKMGMVFQHFALLPHLTVLDNVAFPLDVQGLGRAVREDRARKMIALVGLAGREGAFPRQLSGGQQQRVGIARSLAVEPELWFLDEPFSALDPLIRREMQDEFIRLQSVLKKTIVFITHDFDEAIRLADRIAIMKDGAIVQEGTPEDIVLSPATDYVREFTRAVPRAKVVKVATAMRAPEGAAPATVVGARSTVAEAAPLFMDGTEVIGVTGPDGETIGHLHRADVVALMLGG